MAARVSVLFVAVAAAAPLRQTELKVFLLSGQSNMEGQAEVATKNKTSGEYLNGTLAYQVFVNQTTAPLFGQFWDSSTSNWTVLDDVKMWYNEIGQEIGVNGSVIPSKPGDAAFGSLTTGYGALADPNLFGPELGFGFGMRDALPAGEKFLIMKVAWGGKSLGGDFRPPSSVSSFDVFCQGKCVNEVGHFYQVLVDDVHKMLAPGAIAAMFPDLTGLTPRLAGLGWFQGWNDGCDMNMTAAYEFNMVNLIKDLRAEFGVPDLPVSIPAAGFDGFNNAEAGRTPVRPIPWVDYPPEWKINTNCVVDNQCRRLDIILSQLAAGNSTRHPELGHVVTTETRQFWRDPQFSPNQGQGYHYWHNAETYVHMGLAMAQGMVQAMQG